MRRVVEFAAAQFELAWPSPLATLPPAPRLRRTGTGLSLLVEAVDGWKLIVEKVGSAGSVSLRKVRSMVGLIPLFAVEVLEPETPKKAPEFADI
jgi:hypothetical protein